MFSQSEILQDVSEETSSDGVLTQKLSSAGSETPNLVKRELKGKNFLNIEPHSEKLRKRIVSKRQDTSVKEVSLFFFFYISRNSVN